MVTIVLVGAGSLQFGAGMLGDIFLSPALESARIVLHDIEPAASRRTEALARDHIEAHGLSHVVSVDDALNTALQGADFVVISIEVGDRFKLWNMDWNVPLQFGIRQVYGENGGPGGLFHALRITPPILKICEAIAEHAPNAVVFNYSNPMSRICTTVGRAHPGLKFYGMCHEIASLPRHLPALLDQPLENIAFRAGGLNHFSVMTECRLISTGEDVYPQVLAAAKDYFATLPGSSEYLAEARAGGGIAETEGFMDVEAPAVTDVRGWTERWLFRMVMERFGVLPITTDSHFGEYLAWAQEVVDHRGILDFYTHYRMQLASITPVIAQELHERVVPMIEATVTGEEYVEAAVNLPNRGLIKGLPDWLAVEVPARVSAQGIEGEAVDLPPGIRGLLANQVGIHDMTAEAVLTGRREVAIQALMVDPIVDRAHCLPKLVDHMIEMQRPWLDYLT